MRHVSIWPNAQLLLAHVCALLGLLLKFMIVRFDSPQHTHTHTHALRTVNWISFSFELRHYERGIFFSLCSFADHSRVHASTDFGISPPNAVCSWRINRVLRGNFELTLSCLRLSWSMSVDVERFDALNTFDVNLISGPTANRTNELCPKTKTIANLLLKLTTTWLHAILDSSNGSTHSNGSTWNTVHRTCGTRPSRPNSFATNKIGYTQIRYYYCCWWLAGLRLLVPTMLTTTTLHMCAACCRYL